MASQTNGRNMGEQSTAGGITTNGPASFVVNLADIYRDRTHLQRVRQQLVTSHKSLHDAENYLWAVNEAFLKNYDGQEQKCLDYYQAYKSMEVKYRDMEAKYRDMVTEMHGVTVMNVRLQEDLEKADGVIETANRSLNWARQKICDLESGTMRLEPPPGVATGSKNADVREFDPVIRMPELTRPEDGDGLDTQDTDSTISLVSKGGLASLSPVDERHQNAEESKTAEHGSKIVEHGGQKRSKRGRSRREKPAPANQGLKMG